MSKKTPLTMDGHLCLGKSVKEAMASITDIWSSTMKAFTLKSPVFRGVEKVRHNLMKLRSDLENDMFNRHGSDPRASIEVYYGKLKE